MNSSIYALLAFFGFIFLSWIFWQLDANELSRYEILLSPSLAHPFGTDVLGHDVFARVIEGSFNSLFVGFVSSFIASAIAIIVGVSGAFFRGKTDKTITVLIDIFLTFPTFFLLLALIAYIDASIWVLIIVISVTSWMGGARLIRSEAYKIASMPYIKILVIAKLPAYKIIFKYFAPALAPIVLVNFTFGVSGAILAESSLSFLGLGINSPNISWGLIMAEGKDVGEVAWWISFFAGLFLFLTTYLLINISDYLQNTFNSKVNHES